MTTTNMNRRNFLAGVSLVLARQRWIGDESAAAGNRPAARGSLTGPPGSTSNELDFASALEAAEAIRKKRVSSTALVRRVFERIDRFNSPLNAFTYQLREDALAQAKKADEAQARGRESGILHGVPVHVKECFGVAGHPSTWGFDAFRNSKSLQNSEVVERLLRAGAIIIGATNVPVALSDWQTYNPIYGTTNNPWDLTKTPGGSSGGTAAALAAGLGYLSVGSDIAGSIRVPAHFCGIYGHKPTLDLISMQGMQPGGSQGDPGFSTLLAVAGPMARSAADLRSALKLLGGPTAWDAKAWKWELPPTRSSNMKDFRVGFVLDDLIAPVTPEVKTQMEKMLRSLERTGVTLKPGWPAGVRPSELLDNYLFHLYAFLFSVSTPDQQQIQRKELAESQTPRAAGVLSSFAEWQRQNFRRIEFRALWQTYFKEVDVFLSPVAFSTAFAHDHSEPPEQRKIATSRGPRSYMEMMNWIAPATLTGCPSTVAPIGRTETGLPVGVQIMGPYWEDDTTITFAELLSRELGGFTAPETYVR